MGWIGKNPLLFATILLLMCVAFFGFIIIAKSLYIAIMLYTYIGSEYLIYCAPGTLVGILAIAVVIVFLVLAKMKKAQNKALLICFAALLGLLAFGQFVSGLSFIAYDYEGKNGVEYDDVMYENNVEMYEVKFRPKLNELLSDMKYHWVDMNTIPDEPTLDALQQDFKCCGLHNSTDYRRFGKTAILRSCCKVYVPGERECFIIYKKGCVKEFYKWLTKELIGFGVLLFIASLFTMAATVLMVMLIVTNKKITVPG